MMRRALAPLALAVVVAGCTGAPPPVEGGSPPLAGSAMPDASASSSETAGAIDPGQPYSGDDILDAMRESRRPGGVPDELETPEVARSVAEEVWTFDGRPYDALSVSGSCGGDGCSLDVVGTRSDSAGEDVWTFAAEPGSGEVEILTSQLGATPDALAAQLDVLARDLVPAGYLDRLILGSARWLAPPDTGAFVLAYRSGEEEGSCEVDIVVDAVARRIVAADDPC